MVNENISPLDDILIWIYLIKNHDKVIDNWVLSM